MSRVSVVMMTIAVTALGAVTALDATQWLPPPPRPEQPTAPAPTPLWHIAGQARSGAAADESTAYFVSKQHEAIAVDVATGAIRWRQFTGEWGDLHGGETAVAAGSVVVVGDYNLIAFDRKTGARRWHFEPSDGFGPGLFLGAATETVVFTGSGAGRAYAVEAESGRMRWSTEISTAATASVFSPVLSASLVAVGFSEYSAPAVGGVAMLAADSGRILWKRWFPKPDDPTLATNLGGEPVFHGDVVIAGSSDGMIYAFDIRSGAIKWSLPRVTLPEQSLFAADRDVRPLTITKNILITGSLSGIVHGYDLATRQEKWRFHHEKIGSNSFRIASAEGVAYIPYFSGMVVALDARTGTELWRIGDWRMGFIWPPAFSGNRIIISGSGHGYVALPRILPE